MTKSDFIFMLMRASLWQAPTDHFEMTPWEYKQVMDYSEKQCVLGIIIDCLRSNDIGLQKKCVIHMLKLQNTLELENRRLNENAKQLAKLMDDHGYDYAVVKGQTLAQLYPKPLLRVPGDIDFYVKEADAQKVRVLIEKEWEIQIKDASVDDHKHYPFKYNASNYELHYRLANFSYPPHQRYFDHLVDTMPRKDIIIDGTHVKTLQPTLNLFYTFVHMYHHLRKMGVALRQLCDVAVIIRHHKDEIDRTLLAEILDKTNYRKAFAAFGSIIVEKLGVPEEEFPITISEKDRKWGKKILDDMLRHGNWGKYERETREKKWSIGHSLGTARLLISRYFRYFSLTPTDNIAFLTITSPELFFASVKKLSRKYWRKHVGKQQKS